MASSESSFDPVSGLDPAQQRALLQELRTRLDSQTPEAPFSINSLLSNGMPAGEVAWQLALQQHQRRAKTSRRNSNTVAAILHEEAERGHQPSSSMRE